MSDLLKQLFDILLHIDVHLQLWVTEYRNWTYLILMLIIFCETGFVITPFLPGDSLLFAAGTIAALPGHPLEIQAIIPLLLMAAFGGDNTNYLIGRLIGTQVYEKNYRLIRKDYLDKTHLFYEKHGGKTLVIARFMPIIRTFAPFVAGVGTMRYIRFFLFSITGNILWVVTFSLGGFFFGNIPVIKNNFSLVILGIIVISLLPVLVAFFRKILGERTERRIS
ncbi:MAG TPA: DedA family protein [Bacteroidales bacterium]|nr:DedA family protein [Bacteroidales bacterium]